MDEQAEQEEKLTGEEYLAMVNLLERAQVAGKENLRFVLALMEKLERMGGAELAAARKRGGG